MGNVGNDIKKWLKDNKISQTDVAIRLGKKQPQIANYLNGKKTFGKMMARAFADEFGFNYTFLLTGDGELIADAEETQIMDAVDEDMQADVAPDSAEYWRAKYDAAQIEIVRLNGIIDGMRYAMQAQSGNVPQNEKSASAG